MVEQFEPSLRRNFISYVNALEQISKMTFVVFQLLYFKIIWNQYLMGPRPPFVSLVLNFRDKFEITYWDWSEIYPESGSGCHLCCIKSHLHPCEHLELIFVGIWLVLVPIMWQATSGWSKLDKVGADSLLTVYHQDDDNPDKGTHSKGLWVNTILWKKLSYYSKRDFWVLWICFLILVEITRQVSTLRLPENLSFQVQMNTVVSCFSSERLM